jgi:hypothetical protein
LTALAWKQPLQEKLDIDNEESDFHALNIICDTDKDNDDFCVDFMDEEDNWRRFPSLGERMLINSCAKSAWYARRQHSYNICN